MIITKKDPGGLAFLNYFNDSTEYPDDFIENPIPWGVLWEYVSSAYLNGFINYCEVLDAYVITRYITEKELEKQKKVIEENNLKNWGHHTKLDKFMDDVLILGKISEGYIFFWFDRDVSDCAIGKFKTSDPEEVVKERFFNYSKWACKNCSVIKRDPIKINVFRWLRF